MIGKILGNRYEVIDVIAQGGMSTVYKALDTNLKRYDAIKILKEEYASNNEILDRFKQEANAVAFLSHPNIVNIYNVGSEDGIHYIVMEYVQGRTLKQMIRSQGRLDNETLLNYSFQIARALESAHNSNIIHRDVKPQNIIITKDELVKVTDFGIAKHSDSSTITNSGKIIGSAHYFSPEQARGNLTDQRSDIYSLGIVMYEMATGQVPFDAESPITIALKHMQEELPSPRKMNPGISESIEKVILKATAKNPIDRYQKIEEMLADLRAVMAGDQIMANRKNDNANTQVMGAVNPGSGRNDFDEEIFDDETPSDKKKKILILGLLMILIVVAGAFVGNMIFGNNNGETPPLVDEEVELPDLLGKTVEEAEAVLEELGLFLDVQSYEASDEPEGTIIRMIPDYLEMVRKGTTVMVVVSGGEEELRVPSVVGMTLEAAETILGNNGFTLGNTAEEFSDTVTEGEIIRQEPGVNEMLPRGSAVNVVMSKGPEISISVVPDLINRTEREAEVLLQSEKLELGNTLKVPTGDPAMNGRIRGQNIESGTEVREGTRINVEVFEYTEVTIPGGLIGMRAADVVSRLRALNLEPVLIDGTASTYLVVEVSPASGSAVPYGGRVEILGEPEPQEETPVDPVDPVDPGDPEDPGNGGGNP